jgi:hypothetical protein
MVVFILIAAGCIFQQPTEIQRSNYSVKVSPSPPIITPVQIQCPIPVNTSLPVWMTMNPITDHHPGDVFEINGTIQQKNWTVETEEKIHVLMEYYSPGMHIYGPEGIASQHTSDCEVKTWSYQVNLSRGWPPGEYTIQIYTRNCCGSRVSFFNVTPLDSDISLSGKRL